MDSLPFVETGNEEPLYNIGVVTRMTGITMATLRAWERRYNFPESERTAGGHRLYSERDILHLKWVKARINEGMQTAQAINALRHQENTGNITPREFTELPTAGVTAAGLGEASPVLASFQDRLYQALIQRQIDKADDILGEALVTSTPEELILNVVGPTFSAIGNAWESGEISIASEHLATNYLRQKLLMWMLGGPPAQARPPIVLACAPGEWHEGSLLILGALLRRRRYPVAYLGQAVPLPDLASFVAEIRPSLVILIAMTEETAAELTGWPKWLPEAVRSGRPVVGYGGRIFRDFPEWRQKMQGVYLGDTFQDGIMAIERLLV